MVATAQCDENGSIDVFTPTVQAQPDGVHIDIEVPAGSNIGFIVQDCCGFNAVDGSFVVPVPPGPMPVACLIGDQDPGDDSLFRDISVVDHLGAYVPGSLDCAGANGASALVTSGHPRGPIRSQRRRHRSRGSARVTNSCRSASNAVRRRSSWCGAIVSTSRGSSWNPRTAVGVQMASRAARARASATTTEPPRTHRWSRSCAPCIEAAVRRNGPRSNRVAVVRPTQSHHQLGRSRVRPGPQSVSGSGSSRIGFSLPWKAAGMPKGELQLCDPPGPPWVLLP